MRMTTQPKAEQNQPLKTITISPAKAPQGRPSKLTEEIANEICERVANDESILSICKDAHVPAHSNVREWITKGVIKGSKYALFRDNLARAREEQPDHTYERIMALEQQALVGDLDFRVFRAVSDSMWRRMAARAPKKYGDIRHLDVSGGIDLNISPANKPVSAGTSDTQIEHKPEVTTKRIGGPE